MKPNSSIRLMTVSILLLVLHVFLPGCGDRRAARQAELRALFPPYRLNERPLVEGAEKSARSNVPGAQLVEQIFRSYPQHSSFQLNHELVERQEDPVRVLEILALEPGMSVGDLGCGSGFFTIPFSRLVGERGHVYAIDIQEAAIRFLKDRLADDPDLDPHNNITIIHSKVDDASIPPGTLDAGLFSHSDFYAFYPLLEENTRMLRSVFEAFKPGGRLVVVQYQGLANGDAMSGENISRNFQSIGFIEESAEFHPPANTWYHAFRKPRD